MSHLLASDQHLPCDGNAFRSSRLGVCARDIRPRIESGTETRNSFFMNSAFRALTRGQIPAIKGIRQCSIRRRKSSSNRRSNTARLNIFGRQDGLMKLFQVSEGFQNQEIHFALDQGVNLVTKGFARSWNEVLPSGSILVPSGPTDPATQTLKFFAASAPGERLPGLCPVPCLPGRADSAEKSWRQRYWFRRSRHQREGIRDECSELGPVAKDSVHRRTD